IAVDSSGNAFVVGSTLSSDFPVRNAFQTAYANGTTYGDAFVTEITAGGQNLAYSTYLGGSGDDRALGIALDGSGNVFVTGDTNSADFPTVKALQTAYGGSGDAFVAQIVNPWKNATVCNSTWMWQQGLGYFATTGSALIYQSGLGWLYPVATTANSMWVWDYQWDGKGGWLWTGSSLFPWVYSITENEWFYYSGNSASGSRLFFTRSGQVSTH
ncbi:MAG: SBBP repeat-containing protein, partial [Syntrophobacteraceae bacterium]